MAALDGIYRRLPTALQHAAVSAYGLYWRRLRFGPGYRRHLDGYLARERFDTETWQRWCRGRLRNVLEMATEHVPHYRDTWTPSEKQSARHGRIEDMPLLEKAPLRADPERFVRRDQRLDRRLVFHTSGSTGTPIATVWSVQELRSSLALREARSARWAGTSFDRPRATFSGRMVVPDPNSTGPFHRYNLAERQVYFSPFHLSAAHAPRYAEALVRHRVRWLTGYAVSWYHLARHIVAQKLPVPALDAVVTTSEKLTDAMRDTMAEAYGCRIFEEYSTVENAVFASECEAGRLHVSEDAGFVEILRPDGTACAPGEAGEVVTTCVLRRHQPFVRFRLGDVAAWSPTPCPCGRPLPVIDEVIGRLEDMVVTADGRTMVRFHGIFVDLPHVQEGQIVQHRPDAFTVRVVPTDGFDDHDRQTIVARMHDRLGQAVQVEVAIVEHIPRTAAGKVKAVISEIDASTENA